MAVNLSKAKGTSYLSILQTISLIVSIMVAAVFFRQSVEESAQSFIDQFEKQNYVELSRGDTFAIARRLEGLSKTTNLICIRATKRADIFYESQQGSCNSSVFKLVKSVVGKQNFIRIDFTFTLSAGQAIAIFVLTLIQILIAVAALMSQRLFIFSLHKKDAEAAALSRQIAHDVRSPLAVLQSELGSKFLNPAAHSALRRLSVLADNLTGEDKPEILQPVLPMLEEVLLEKRCEFGAKAMFELTCLGAEGISRLNGDSFIWKRVFSNILNNAFEARVQDPAQISLSIRFNGPDLQILIVDLGRGVPKFIQKDPGGRALSFGKKHGKGMGLSSARTFLYSIGGKLQVVSVPGKTEVQISVPKIERPSIVLIDDDTDIAFIWKLASRKVDFTFHHFKSLELFLEGRGEIENTALIFLDGEFEGKVMNLSKAGSTLRRLGFRELYIASGRDVDLSALKKLYRDQVGKTPPWLKRPSRSKPDV